VTRRGKLVFGFVLVLATSGFGPADFALQPTAPAETSGEGRREIRIALQAGHWRAEEAPRELRGIRGNGTRWERTHEWEVNLDIAERAAELLRTQGYDVDVLPAVIPQRYEADLFIAIHADGSSDPRARGFRVASARRDRTGQAGNAADVLALAYGEATELPRLHTTTRRMRNYYAFNNRRYRHALHPRTPGVIIETGFLTNEDDRGVIVHDPDRAALGIAAAVMAFPETAPPGDEAGLPR
jgi:N-acetylmuramoyl-L-alanine amidase